MRKLVSVALALLLLFSLSVFPAWAAEGDPASSSDSSGSGSSGGSGKQPSIQRSPTEEKSLAYWEATRGSIQLTGDLRKDILIITRAQLGYSADLFYYEQEPSGKQRFYTRYGEWYGRKFSDWCDMFVCFCIYYAGGTDYPFESSCMRHVYALKEAGYWREWNCYIPQAGDLVFFNPGRKQLYPDHVGVIEAILPGDGTTPSLLLVIDGNMASSNYGAPCVRRSVYSVADVVGYGVYERGKTYPPKDTVRSEGWQVIGPDSVYFVDYPTEEALRFLGLRGTKYYEFWFPEPTPGPEALSLRARVQQIAEEVDLLELKLAPLLGWIEGDR
ncbi:MAG: CHAP domain-containing protein [Clostridia bacterium]|nr:CHAP domain-containing protein [Clostridia bacterium]MBR0422863.1 CHAP domain-containing protein [Clostridia bacterium]